jgi:hypothetical protein
VCPTSLDVDVLAAGELQPPLTFFDPSGECAGFGLRRSDRPLGDTALLGQLTGLQLGLGEFLLQPRLPGGQLGQLRQLSADLPGLGQQLVPCALAEPLTQPGQFGLGLVHGGDQALPLPDGLLLGLLGLPLLLFVDEPVDGLGRHRMVVGAADRARHPAGEARGQLGRHSVDPALTHVKPSLPRELVLIDRFAQHLLRLGHRLLGRRHLICFAQGHREFARPRPYAVKSRLGLRRDGDLLAEPAHPLRDGDEVLAERSGLLGRALSPRRQLLQADPVKPLLPGFGDQARELTGLLAERSGVRPQHRDLTGCRATDGFELLLTGMLDPLNLFEPGNALVELRCHLDDHCGPPGFGHLDRPLLTLFSLLGKLGQLILRGLDAADAFGRGLSLLQIDLGLVPRGQSAVLQRLGRVHGI